MELISWFVVSRRCLTIRALALSLSIFAPLPAARAGAERGVDLGGNRVAPSVGERATGSGAQLRQYQGQRVTVPLGERRAASPKRNVVINRERLSDETIFALERQYRVRIQDGAYWYDRTSGAWGVEGGPTAGFILPRLNLGGPLRADASRGRTRVFVNGRELHYLDVLGLQQLLQGPVLQGRYWVDARGNCGYEGGPALINLMQLARAAQGRRGGAWSYHSSSGGHVGGDGNFTYYIDRNSSYTSAP